MTLCNRATRIVPLGRALTLAKAPCPARYLVLAMLGALLLSSCNNSGGSSLEGNTVLTIQLGTLPGELDWFYRSGYKVAATADIQSLDDRVYISGGKTGKIMVFEQNGNLQTLVYDPRKSRVPSSAREEKSESHVARTFYSPGHIAVTSTGFLVEDSVDPDTVSGGTAYNPNNSVVLMFNLDGTYTGYIGREGRDGSPFPYMDNLSVRDDGVMVVTCRVVSGWLMYWYDSGGSLLLTVSIDNNQLPRSRGGNRINVYSIRPDPLRWVAHIRMDEYAPEQDGGNPEAWLYTFDLNSREFSNPLGIEYSFNTNGIPDVPPDYLGTLSNGNHVLVRPEGSGSYRLLLLNEEGRIVQNRRLGINPAYNIYRRLRLQSGGLLTGIFMGLNEAVVTRWQLDPS